MALLLPCPSCICIVFECHQQTAAFQCVADFARAVTPETPLLVVLQRTPAQNSTVTGLCVTGDGQEHSCGVGYCTLLHAVHTVCDVAMATAQPDVVYAHPCLHDRCPSPVVSLSCVPLHLKCTVAVGEVQ